MASIIKSCNLSHAVLINSVLSLAACLLPNSSSAQLGFGITGSLEHLGNPKGLNDPPESEEVSLVSVDTILARETQRFITAFNYRASSSNYRNDILDDREIVEGGGQITWKISPNALQWNLQNSRSNELISAFEPDISDNRQIINRSSTGPVLNLPIGAANLLYLQSDFSEVDYGETGFLDQSRNSVVANLSRQLTRNITASLRSSITRTKFDSEFVPEYDFSSYSLMGSYENNTFNSSLEVGTYKSQRAGEGSTSNSLLDVSASYRINSSSEISANLSESVEDLLSDLRSADSVFGLVSSPEPALNPASQFGSSNSSGLFVKQTISAEYAYSRDSGLNLLLDFTKDERTFQSRDQQEINERTSLTVSMPLSSRLNFSFTANYSDLQFPDLNSTQKRTELGTSVNYQLNEQISLNFALRNTNQISNSLLTTYDGLSSYFGISYRRNGR